MKKFLILAIASILIYSSTFAQSTVQVAPATGDIIVNTGTVTKKITVTTGISGLWVGFVGVLNSGTGAGTIQMQVSPDGVNYVNSGSAYTITNVATQVTTFSIAAPVPQYVAFVITGSGTENITFKTYYRAPKYQPTP